MAGCRWVKPAKQGSALKLWFQWEWAKLAPVTSGFAAMPERSSLSTIFRVQGTGSGWEGEAGLELCRWVKTRWVGAVKYAVEGREF